ncbi:MAG: bifunctional 5,10-methylenetetrahydrofolate dehydrogenase/5,10-methenyltetrahydrofolate cyclohydrolase [Halobacteria archaeon]|nr:bifunctional 5,10-methylenetetrahydrofolate dehydrogenase/5,10-methenyltetrahydrofolate cyclohydrolase [Halobacteria archaeon]
MEIIDGKEVAQEVKDELTRKVKEMETTPKLVAVLMSDDPASETYVRMKRKACDEVGIKSETIRIDADGSESELLSTIERLNEDDSVNGFIVQLPLPDHISEERALKSVSPVKDVDGFHPENKGLLMEGKERFVPATPAGIQRLLVSSGNPPEGNNVVILGRSNIVGKPLANLLMQKKENANATVTVCHSNTRDLKEHTKRADILVASVGVPRFVTSDMVSEGVVVIDVGINRVDADNEKGYELVGDVDFGPVSRKAEAMTPVPGGVGPMTVAMLLSNTVKATELQKS